MLAVNSDQQRVRSLSVKLLLVEDNKALAEGLSLSLAAAGHEIVCAASVAEAVSHLRQAEFETIVLDLGLPDGDGLKILEDGHRRRHVPVLILTARASIAERVAGLQAGADDYLVKPFATEELLARLEVIARRLHPEEPGSLQLANLSFDVAHRHVAVGHAATGQHMLTLSMRELDILEHLLRRKNRVVAKRALEDNLFGLSDEGGANAIEVYVHRLRKKLLESGAAIDIHTVRGVGYCIKERK